MAQNEYVRVNGAVIAGPVVSPPGGPSLQEVASLAISASYGSSKSARPSIVNATMVSPYAIPLDTITKVRLLFVRVVSGNSIKLLLTSPSGGADQVVPVSDQALLHCPNPGDEFTAVKIVGSADLNVFLAGDVG